ncbi:MAG: hypothetical protein ACPG0K_00430 [Flavobacteriaceae bacterium]
MAIEKDRIEGTQIPTKIPSSLYPENHNDTESRNEIKARIIG